jgi:hypothetical protein
MDNNIRVQEALLDDMRLDMKVLESKKVPEDPKARAKRESQINSQQESIDAYYQAITRLRREREQTSEKYERILSEFRELTAE